MGIIYQPKGRALEYSPLATNIYENCNHGCRYCFAPDCLFRARSSYLPTATVQPKHDYLARLRECARNWKGPKDRVLLCFTCDPYPANVDTTITRETIKTLHEYGFPVQILTKGGLSSCRDFDLLGRGDAYAATLTFVDPEDSAYQEPGAASPRDRMQALQIAHDSGIETWASMEPVLDPEQTLTLIKYTAPYVDLFKVGKLNPQKTMPDDLRQLAKTIDWAKFARDAVALLERLDKRYYIKNDLRAYLEGDK